MMYLGDRSHKRLPRFLRLDQVESLFNAAKNEKDRLMMKLLFYCGLRNSEVIKLNISDFDFKARTLFIRQSKRDKDRYVPIPEIIIPEIKEYIGSLHDRLFLISDRQIRRIVKEAAYAAKIQGPEGIHPHTLRHSYATYLLDNGVPLANIQMLLGHDDIKVTTIYTHMSTARGRELIDMVFKKREMSENELLSENREGLKAK